MKKILSISILSLIVPQIVFAAWWNPLSWFNGWSFFHRVEKTKSIDLNTELQNQNTVASTTSQGTILCNGQYWNECPSGQLLVCPIEKNVDAYCSVPKNPETKTLNPASTPNTTAKPVVSSPVPTVTTPQPTKPVSVVAEKNFYYESVSVIRELIAEEQSYVDWLIDTKNQFRTAVTLLSSKPYSGGLIGDARIAALDLANTEINIISSSISSGQGLVASFQTALDSVSDNKFVSEKDFNSLPSVEKLRSDNKAYENRRSSSLQEVMQTLKY